ncbi:MAG: ATP-binding cassette domain-containing protein [Dehalococcoidales bacterium]|nr:MAG: ATP-binding cassette domain-containing protein [Dehalococcoidales bacterium]
MPFIEVNHISKTYGDRAVVNDVSFDVNGGEIFGLIGPNGAGKTTTIRIMMDLIKPDSGEVLVLGRRLGEAVKDDIGYLPEERGLYLNLTVVESLTYFASLKGMEIHRAATRADELLARVDLLPHKQKKIKELSRGMGQFVQFLVTIIHEPKLIILDEPFANLDPVNTQVIKDMVFEMRNQGRAIILSTHRMNEVEELCDRILMINEGHTVLYGDLAEIKSRYRNNSVLLEFEGELGQVSGVIKRQDHDGRTELFLDSETTPQQVLAQLLGQGVTVNRFEVATPPLHDIFLQVVGEHQ